MVPLVSVLFVTYRRFHLLQRTVETFLQHTDYANLELIVADDGSPRSVQNQISTLPVNRVLLSDRNRGFGANANAGLRHCNGEYILFLQDDWECCGPTEYLSDAVCAFQKHPQIGFIKFYGHNQSTNSAHQLDEETGLCEIENPTLITELNRHIYSDTPHLRSRACLEALGEYDARVPMEQCEREYEERFLLQHKFSTAYLPKHMNVVFTHTGEKESFRTGSRRARFERIIHPLTGPMHDRAAPAYHVLRSCYRTGVRLLYRAGAIR